MEITAQEKLMYEVMRSIYESDVPISFKGSVVLKACLIEAGYKHPSSHLLCNNHHMLLDSIHHYL